MGALRVICTGPREFNNGELAWSVLNALYAHHEPLTVVHGACPMGADRLVQDWADQRGQHGSAVRVVRFPIDWGLYGPKAAGPIRNARMIAAGADLVVAFFVDPGGRDPMLANRGTLDTVRRAEQRGIPVRRYGWVPTDQHALL